MTEQRYYVNNLRITLSKTYKDEITGKTLSHREYLYGKEFVALDVPQEVVNSKLEVLSEQLAIHLEHSFYIRDGKRVNAIIKAIKFWENIN